MADGSCSSTFCARDLVAEYETPVETDCLETRESHWFSSSSRQRSESSKRKFKQLEAGHHAYLIERDRLKSSVVSTGRREAAW